MLCYLEFKRRYMKPKLFSIRVKELFEPLVLRSKADRFLLFLKAFSWETNLRVTLGDFTVKKLKIEKGNLYLTENRLGRNEIRCVDDKHNYVSHMSKRIFRFELWLRSYWQNINFFTILPQISYVHKILNFLNFKYNWNFLDQLLLPYKKVCKEYNL